MKIDFNAFALPKIKKEWAFLLYFDSFHPFNISRKDGISFISLSFVIIPIIF